MVGWYFVVTTREHPSLADRARVNKGECRSPLIPNAHVRATQSFRLWRRLRVSVTKFLPVRLNWFVKSRFILSFGY